MTSNPSEGYPDRAIRHAVRVRNYRDQADLLLRRDRDIDCAGALLYEAAKQCINAVANQRGANPGTTGGKVRVLREVVLEERDGWVLLRDWQSADKLHIHADRGNLTVSAFGEHWAQTQAFIVAMLDIYRRNS